MIDTDDEKNNKELCDSIRNDVHYVLLTDEDKAFVEGTKIYETINVYAKHNVLDTIFKKLELCKIGELILPGRTVTPTLKPSIVPSGHSSGFRESGSQIEYRLDDNHFTYLTRDFFKVYVNCVGLGSKTRAAKVQDDCHNIDVDKIRRFLITRLKKLQKRVEEAEVRRVNQIRDEEERKVQAKVKLNERFDIDAIKEMGLNVDEESTFAVWTENPVNEAGEYAGERTLARLNVGHNQETNPVIIYVKDEELPAFLVAAGLVEDSPERRAAYNDLLLALKDLRLLQHAFNTGAGHQLKIKDDQLVGVLQVLKSVINEESS